MAPELQTIIDDDEEFLDDVAAYYEKRGLPFDREGKINGRPISLHALYKLVMDRGGYDVVSGIKLQWRQLVKDFLFKDYGFAKIHEGPLAFQLKSLYYKNLAAYEISTYWGEDPPPREIFEDVSAKGGDLRTRTLENFGGATRQVDSAQPEGNDSAAEDSMTPKREPAEAEDSGSASRYPSRSLRQDPKRTQLYQPEVTSTRRNLHAVTNSPLPSSPTPQQSFRDTGAAAAAAAAAARAGPFKIENYHPTQSHGLTLQPVITPGNNPDLFYQRKAMAKVMKHPPASPEPQTYLRGMVNMSGPNIYLRCLMGLRSGVETEQDFALHHLVRISFERGDKYKFEGFPHLAEALLEKALEISQLIYGFRWEISYEQEDGNFRANMLNAAFGTLDLQEKLEWFSAQEPKSDIESPDFGQRLERLKEAILVLRNMVMLDENAVFIAKMPMCRDFLAIALALPNQARLVEFKHSALEIAEQLTRYWIMAPKDPLYQAIVPYLESNDRGLLLPAMRSIVRISMDTEATHQISDIPSSTIQRLLSLVLLDVDNELLEHTLDFLYGYTANHVNNTALLQNFPSLYPSMIPRLTTLLLHNATNIEETFPSQRPTPPNPSIPATIPIIPADLYNQLVALPETNRSTRWLRCCFEESPQDDITQIAIWQAYQSRFAQHNPIAAADFIKNVSSTFTNAQAQVINGPQPRFIIKGIKARRVLVGLDGEPLWKCMWATKRPEPGMEKSLRHACPQWFSSPKQLWDHILLHHLMVPKTETGQFESEMSIDGDTPCKWMGCTHRFDGLLTSAQMGSHLKNHIPTAKSEAKAQVDAVYEGKQQDVVAPMKHKFAYTAIDGPHPCGVPWMACLILRNLARWANKHDREHSGGRQDGARNKNKNETGHGDGASDGLVQKLFGGQMYRIFEAIGTNRILKPMLADLMSLIELRELEEQGEIRKRKRMEMEDAEFQDA